MWCADFCRASRGWLHYVSDGKPPLVVLQQPLGYGAAPSARLPFCCTPSPLWQVSQYGWRGSVLVLVHHHKRGCRCRLGCRRECNSAAFPPLPLVLCRCFKSGRRWDGVCHFAASPSPFVRCFNRDGEGGCQQNDRTLADGQARTAPTPAPPPPAPPPAALGSADNPPR